MINEELKLIIYRLHDCVHKNPKISTENLLKLSEFHKSLDTKSILK